MTFLIYHVLGGIGNWHLTQIFNTPHPGKFRRKLLGKADGMRRGGGIFVFHPEYGGIQPIPLHFCGVFRCRGNVSNGK
jgi:hypothetical protein